MDTTEVESIASNQSLHRTAAQHLGCGCVGNRVRERFPIQGTGIDGTPSSLPSILTSRSSGFPAWGDDLEAIGSRFGTVSNRGGSGTRPEQALEAINPSSRAQRESHSSLELPCARRAGPAEPSPGRGNDPAIPGYRTFRHHPLIQHRKSFPDPVSGAIQFTGRPRRTRPRARGRRPGRSTTRWPDGGARRAATTPRRGPPVRAGLPSSR